MESHTGKEKWKRLDTTKLKDKNLGRGDDLSGEEKKGVRVYGDKGKEWPRLTITVCDDYHGTGCRVSCSRKDDPERWWGEYPVPKSLAPELLELLHEYVKDLG